ncbi:MAG: hypothetical protein ACLUOF_08340 [Ruminococcus sp.]
MGQGNPVVIGEYGCPKKNKEEESVRKFLSSVCGAAYERDMCPVLWISQTCTTTGTTARCMMTR